jgi:hypothetical protein
MRWGEGGGKNKLEEMEGEKEGEREGEGGAVSNIS